MNTDVLAPQRDSRPAEILRLVARDGALTIADIVRAIGITTTAVRQHVNRLLWEGWLVRDRRHCGPGRPADVFSLSERAKRTFAHEVDEFARLLMQEIAATDGPGKLQAMLAHVSQRIAQGMESQAGTGLPAQRVETLVHTLQERGTVVDTQRTADGLQLSVHTCPFHGLGDVRRELCEVERQTLGRLGGGPARLKQSIADGQACCEFEVHLAADAAPAIGLEKESVERQ